MNLIHDWIGIDKNIGFRCSKCKRFRSAKNEMVQGEIRLEIAENFARFLRQWQQMVVCTQRS